MMARLSVEVLLEGLVNETSVKRLFRSGKQGKETDWRRWSTQRRIRRIRMIATIGLKRKRRKGYSQKPVIFTALEEDHPIKTDHSRNDGNKCPDLFSLNRVISCKCLPLTKPNGERGSRETRKCNWKGSASLGYSMEKDQSDKKRRTNTDRYQKHQWLKIEKCSFKSEIYIESIFNQLTN